MKVLPRDTQLYVLREKDGWAAIDVEGDGAIDGWVSKDFLKIHKP
jgi:lysozyme